MPVPAAKSSGSWVQPCSITTSARGLPAQPGGTKSLKLRVRPACVCVPLVNVAAAGGVALAAATAGAAVSNSNTQPSSTMAAVSGRAGGATAPAPRKAC